MEYIYNEKLGVDETLPGSIFTTTDFDVVNKKIQQKINNDINLDTASKKLLLKQLPSDVFLTHFINAARVLKFPYDGTFTTLTQYKNYLESNIKTTYWTIYLKYMGELIKEGQIPNTILKPWTYKPEKEKSIISNIFGKGEKILDKIIIIITGISIFYILRK